MLAIEEYEKIQRQVEERTERKETLSKERMNLIDRIEKYEQMKFEAFMTAFKAIDANFREIFARLTSGSGNLVLENEEDPFTGGLTFAVKPRDKKVHLLSSLSGGEKSLTTLAFIFSIQHYIPAPFYAFDEVDMSLDGANVERIAGMIQELAPSSQFVIVSLRKPMIEAAQRIMGVTSRRTRARLLPESRSMAEQNGKHRVDKGAKAGRAGEPAPAKFPGEQPENEDPDPVVITGTHDSAMSEVSPGAADTPAAPAPEIIEDPVEILVGLAERGEIDPWNINIIEVTDRFLSELERCRQLNLQISGRTLFYAATLLRMKSEQLDLVSDEEDDGTDGEGEDFDFAGDLDFEDVGRFGPIERLEREIQRRLDRKSLRKSPVTLFELIIELKNLEKEERRRRRLPRPRTISLLKPTMSWASPMRRGTRTRPGRSSKSAWQMPTRTPRSRSPSSAAISAGAFPMCISRCSF